MDILTMTRSGVSNACSNGGCHKRPEPPSSNALLNAVVGLGIAPSGAVVGQRDALLSSRTKTGATPSTVGPAAPTGTPLKPEPTIVTKADITDYVGILMPLIKGLNGDILANTIYLDPNVEHNSAEELFKKAGDLDGCYQGTTCPDMTPGAPEPSYSDGKKYLAHQYRLQGFQHIVDARLMEDKIKAREATGKKVTNAQIAKEVAFWQEWLDFRKRMEGYLTSVDKALIVKASDFQNLQQYDLQLQQYRSRYSGLTGLQPSIPLPPGTPHPPDSGIPWTGLMVLGGAVVALLLLREVRPERAVIVERVSSPPERAPATRPRSLPAAEPEPTTVRRSSRRSEEVEPSTVRRSSRRDTVAESGVRTVRSGDAPRTVRTRTLLTGTSD